MPRRNADHEIVFSGFPEFTPNLTPREIFKLGSFGGTYWRPIHSRVTGRNHTRARAEFPKSWWRGIPVESLDSPFEDYDVSLNKYGVRVGTTLEFWETKKWITSQDPYGWVQWYCRFYAGRRSPDDARQISRWCKIAGPNGRFRMALANKCALAVRHRKVTAAAAAVDHDISPRVRQTLQHWGFVISAKDVRDRLR
jgi:hypothetical protein